VGDGKIVIAYLNSAWKGTLQTPFMCEKLVSYCNPRRGPKSPMFITAWTLHDTFPAFERQKQNG